MRTKEIFVENTELLNLVEALQYETEARKEIIAYMIDKGLSESSNFESYQKEYREFFIRLNTAKNSLEQEIRRIIPEGGELVSWNLEFFDKKITAVYKETGDVR